MRARTYLGSVPKKSLKKWTNLESVPIAKRVEKIELKKKQIGVL